MMPKHVIKVENCQK